MIEKNDKSEAKEAKKPFIFKEALTAMCNSVRDIFRKSPQQLPKEELKVVEVRQEISEVKEMEATETETTETEATTKTEPIKKEVEAQQPVKKERPSRTKIYPTEKYTKKKQGRLERSIRKETDSNKLPVVNGVSDEEYGKLLSQSLIPIKEKTTSRNKQGLKTSRRSKKPLSRLDLHTFKSCNDARMGAITFLNKHISSGSKKIHIICGRGKHSPNGQAILPIMLEEVLSEMKFEQKVKKVEIISDGGSYIVFLR